MMPTGSQIDSHRERLFNELAEEVAQFDRLGNLVRRVSQLVKPSVIHIEAHKVTGKGAAAESYDEAGSGVVLEIAGDRWVLTNRHVIKGASADQIVMRTSDGRRWAPDKILMDASTDVAVMKLTTAPYRSRGAGRRPMPAAERMPPAARIAAGLSKETNHDTTNLPNHHTHARVDRSGVRPHRNDARQEHRPVHRTRSPDCS
ncbi:MAG: trypsin-like peptidase domain-containing protein, partial [Rhodopirellula sp. JB053]